MDIYRGLRGKRFQDMIDNVLKFSGMKDEDRKRFLSPSSLSLYDQVFTHSSANSESNYEYLEFLGDTTLNKSVAWYLSQRFPQLNCSMGVKILTRLKINLISKRSFAYFAKRMNFWHFVSADAETRQNKMDKTLEDVFEAFFGATELLIDKFIYDGAGYKVCYNIIHSLLETEIISLKYEDLFDAKTRLKEVFDYFQRDGTLGQLKYLSEKEDRIHHITVVNLQNGVEQILGKGSAYLKADAQQKAAEIAISTLKENGFEKPLSEDYIKILEK